jgi:hypothetical protein
MSLSFVQKFGLERFVSLEFEPHLFMSLFSYRESSHQLTLARSSRNGLR